MRVKQPRMSHLVSSLSSMAVFFLQRDQALEAALSPPFAATDYVVAIAQPFLRQHAVAARIVADTVKWNSLCMSVQEMDLAGQRKQVFEFIRDYIERFHAAPASNARAGGGAGACGKADFSSLKHHQHLQSYFLYTDAAITFAHLLSEGEYVALLQKAVTHTRSVVQACRHAGRQAGRRAFGSEG
jgi:hypothetical protein